MSSENCLPRCAPEEQGMSSAAIHGFVEAVEKQNIELHSFMLLRHGAVVAEGGWTPYNPSRPHMLFSLSKSFTSTAIGLAVAEGRLSVEDRVLSFFPDETPARVSKNLDMMQVRHLLSMSTGHAQDTTLFMHKRRDDNWIKGFLVRPVQHKPGSFFLYNTGATFMLSAIIQKLTGMTLLDYLQPRLFEPLGIKHPTWEMSPQGINTGGYGLSITTEDIARFGQLYLQKGCWIGRQLVPEAWIEQATSRQVANGSDENSDWNQGYGYQFWRSRHGAYRGDGAFGQYCIVMPDQNAVLAITGGLGDMQVVLNLVWQHLLPAMGKRNPQPDQALAHEALTQKLNSLAYQPPQGAVSSPISASVSGKTFVMEPNAQRFKTMSFDFSKPDPVITIRSPRSKHQIVCGAGAWREGRFDLVRHSPHLIASGIWSDETTFVMTFRFYETPFVYTMICHFAGDHLTIDGAINVSFGPTKFSLAGQTKN
ncbi:MAG: serine hydrolase [Chloroflexi bacterium]|nr:serine hydrolase [Chloroflexota bacterium]